MSGAPSRARDLEELRALGQRYARAIDARDIDAVAALFHPGATVEGARGLLGIGPYLDGLRHAPRVFETSMHVLGEALIELPPDGDTATPDTATLDTATLDTATLDTYAVVYQLRAADAAEGDLILGIRYLDEVVRHDGRWVIRSRVARTLWSRVLRSCAGASPIS